MPRHGPTRGIINATFAGGLDVILLTAAGMAPPDVVIAWPTVRIDDSRSGTSPLSNSEGWVRR